MLPEGPALEGMAALARVRPVDTYGILAAFGRDCAGAIMVLPDGDRPGGNADSGYSPMTPGDLQRVIGALDVAGVPVLAVKRYDRKDAPARGIPVRVHQEDGCQATATPPGLKYEEQGGPALRDFADVIRNFGDPSDVTGLLRRTTFNMAVGNADAHAKNFSILHEPGIPAVALAPLYDVLSTIALKLTDSTGQPMRADTHLGQRVGGQADIRTVTAAIACPVIPYYPSARNLPQDDSPYSACHKLILAGEGCLIDEAAGWGIRRRAASAVVTETLDQVLAAVAAVPGDAQVLDVIREQAERISRG